jgi:hypothetical protein
MFSRAMGSRRRGGASADSRQLGKSYSCHTIERIRRRRGEGWRWLTRTHRAPPLGAGACSKRRRKTPGRDWASSLHAGHQERTRPPRDGINGSAVTVAVSRLQTGPRTPTSRPLSRGSGSALERAKPVLQCEGWRPLESPAALLKQGAGAYWAVGDRPHGLDGHRSASAKSMAGDDKQAQAIARHGHHQAHGLQDGSPPTSRSA